MVSRINDYKATQDPATGLWTVSSASGPMFVDLITGQQTFSSPQSVSAAIEKHAAEEARKLRPAQEVLFEDNGNISPNQQIVR